MTTAEPPRKDITVSLTEAQANELDGIVRAGYMKLWFDDRTPGGPHRWAAFYKTQKAIRGAWPKEGDIDEQ